MVDPPIVQNQSNADETLKTFMEKTPALLKSKFLSVLDSSNDLLNDISNRLEFSLSLSASSDTETVDTETIANIHNDDESLDENIIDFESRKVKERRAHEEIISGKYRQPNLIGKIILNEYNIVDINPKSSSSNSDCSSDTSTPNFDNQSIPGSIDITDKLDDLELHEEVIKEDLDNKNNEVDNRSSRPSTSQHDPVQSSEQSQDLNFWIRSESENSLPSWASSIAFDSQTEEAIVTFMTTFVFRLFEDSSSISLDDKSEFGLKARLSLPEPCQSEPVTRGTKTETGRLWFARLVSAQRAKSKRVNETTLYSLIQHFAIVLFECSDSEDYSPAKILMNMCFTFYHEIEVPGCQPYQEYLFHYLRAQPIWQSLRFWNAAFFDALQCQRIHRPIPLANIQSKDQISLKSTSTTSSPNYNEDHNNILNEDQQFQQNISFGQLGTFTCNMHAFGLSRELCTEFLRKQSIIANLTAEQEKMLRNNVNRMYKETAKWRD